MFGNHHPFRNEEIPQAQGKRVLSINNHLLDNLVERLWSGLEQLNQIALPKVNDFQIPVDQGVGKD